MPSKTIPGVKRKDISVVSDPNLIRIADGFNHRVDFNEEKMAQLVESIRQHGVRVPISVRPDKGNKKTIRRGHSRSARHTLRRRSC